MEILDWAFDVMCFQRFCPGGVYLRRQRAVGPLDIHHYPVPSNCLSDKLVTPAVRAGCMHSVNGNFYSPRQLKLDDKLKSLGARRIEVKDSVSNVTCVYYKSNEFAQIIRYILDNALLYSACMRFTIEDILIPVHTIVAASSFAPPCCIRW